MFLLPLLIAITAPGNAAVRIERGVRISAETPLAVSGAQRHEYVDGDTRLILVEFE